MGNNFTPAWIKKGFFNESLFCDDFLSTHQLLYVNGAFFTPDGRVTDTMNLRCEIFDMLRDHIGANIAKRVSNVVDVLKLAAYYKWMFRGMEKFQILPEVAEKIRELSVMGDTSEMWKPPFPPGWNPYVNQLDPRVGRIEEICQAVVGELRKQGLTDSRDAFLEAHTWEIMKRIQDPELKKCHVMEG